MKTKSKVEEEKWDLSDLPANWTVDDIEARAPRSVRETPRLFRLTLQMPEHTDGYEPEFFLNLNFEERMSATKRLQKLVKSGRLTGFEFRGESPARADFIDTLIETLRKPRKGAR